MDERRKLILKLREKCVTYREIGLFLGISGQYAGYLANGYSNVIPAEHHKRWTAAKRATLGIPITKIPDAEILGGRGFIRELVRIRDNHTCQICQKKWVEGQRRFDVHHQDEEEEGKSKMKDCVKRDKESFFRMTTLCHKCHLNLDSVQSRRQVVI